MTEIWNDKHITTILSCCDAFGNYLPTQVIYKGPNLIKSWLKDGPVGVHYNTSQSGWMESEQFIEWFRRIFLVHANKLAGKKLLILDGHASHVSLQLKKLAADNNIILFRPPAHTSHFLQPLDVGVFKTVKSEWRKVVNSFLIQNKYMSLTNRQFPAMLKHLIEKDGFKAENARCGFANTWIFPLDRTKIRNDKTAIGSIFQENQSDTTTNFSSTLVLSDISNFSTPRMKRANNTELILNSIEQLNNTVKQTGQNIQKSVLSSLKERLTPSVSGRREKGQRLKRSANFNMTSEEATKKQKLDQVMANRFVREEKKGYTNDSRVKEKRKEAS